MSDIYIYGEEERMPRPNHGNNCHGHFTSISAGGNGHSVGDGCSCNNTSLEEDYAQQEIEENDENGFDF